MEDLVEETLLQIWKEYTRLRNSNLAHLQIGNFSEMKLFSEIIVGISLLEGMLRWKLSLEPNAVINDKDTLPNLLEQMSGQKLNMFSKHAKINMRAFIKVISALRNGVLHGNWKQVAGKKTIDQYFENGFYRHIDFVHNSIGMLFLTLKSSNFDQSKIDGLKAASLEKTLEIRRDIYKIDDDQEFADYMDNLWKSK